MDQEFKQLALFFNKVEDENNLFQDKVNGIEIWKYIRREVFRIILSKKYDIFHESKAKKEYRKKNNITADYNNILQDLLVKYRKRNIFLQQKDILFFTMDRRLWVDGRYLCPYTDLILDQLKISYTIIQMLGDENMALKSKTRNLRYLDQDMITEKYASLEERVKRSEANSFIQRMEACLQINFDNDEKKEIGKNIEEAIRYRRIYKEYFNDILSKLKPKVVCVIPSTRYIVMHLIETAKERGIPVVEMQHGAINDIAIQHNFLRKQEVSTYADYIFEFGQNIIKGVRYPIANNKVIPIGYSYLEYVGAKTKENVKKNNNIKTILILSSRQDKLQELAIKLSTDLDPKAYRIVFKLHPHEYKIWKERFPLLRRSRVKVISNDKYSLYYCLAKSDIVLGINSTALYEAVMFDVAILIYKDSDYQISRFLYENGIAELISSYEQLKDTITASNVVSSGSYEKVFTKNSIDNFNREIKKIIDQGK